MRLKGKRALLVEDELLVGMGLKAGLEQLGAEVTWCNDIGSALEVLNGPSRHDMAVVDTNLNGVMSSPVLDRLMGMDIYTVISSGYDASALEARFQHLPRCEKPFTRAKMRRLLVGRT
jgi:DNA-binding response OmpR family regulator